MAYFTIDVANSAKLFRFCAGRLLEPVNELEGFLWRQGIRVEFAEQLVSLRGFARFDRGRRKGGE